MEVYLDKEKIARCFLRGQKTYDQHATVQKKVSRKLIQLLGEYPEISYDRVLEIGCCTGSMTEELVRHHTIAKLFLNDLVPDFYKTVQERLPDEVTRIIEPKFGDIEAVELPENLDLVISSSTFQWLVDIKTFFSNVSNALRANGYIVFSIFGPGTLAEIKELTEVGLEYAPLGGMLDILEDKFRIELADTVKDVLYFATPREILRHLQATGVGGVSEHRWTSQGLLQFEADYIEKFGTSSGVPITFVSSFVVASKK